MTPSCSHSSEDRSKYEHCSVDTAVVSDPVSALNSCRVDGAVSAGRWMAAPVESNTSTVTTPVDTYCDDTAKLYGFTLHCKRRRAMDVSLVADNSRGPNVDENDKMLDRVDEVVDVDSVDEDTTATVTDRPSPALVVGDWSVTRLDRMLLARASAELIDSLDTSGPYVGSDTVCKRRAAVAAGVDSPDSWNSTAVAFSTPAMMDSMDDIDDDDSVELPSCKEAAYTQAGQHGRLVHAKGEGVSPTLQQTLVRAMHGVH